MKKVLYPINAFLLCVVMLFSACETDNSITGGDDDEEASKCGEASNSLVDRYEDDAVLLAINSLNDSESVIDPSIIIPPALVERMSNILTAVHASEFAAADSVTNVYEVHINSLSSLNQVSLLVDNSAAWAEGWINGEYFTGEPSIDQLLTTYDLEVSQTQPFSNFLGVTITSEELINTTELAAKFASVDGVSEATVPSDGTGDGDDIVVEVLGANDLYKVTYEVAYDGCSETCQKARFYEFNVDDNCNVTYISTYGDAPPTQAQRDEE